MAEVLPATTSSLTRVRTIAAQPAVRRAMPWFAGATGLGALALAWFTLVPAPQRILFAELDDGQRAGVAATLDKSGITYAIDNATGQVTVGENDLYRARMMVAADGAMPNGEDQAASLDTLPLGASRNLEGERLRAAREHDLELTIKQIDGIEAVRVHLAEATQSVFVRDNAPPSASVMVKLGRGRQLGESQVLAIVNLVAASVSGLSPDAVRVVDSSGHLLSDQKDPNSRRLDLQAQMEGKLRGQIDQLLTPMFGPGNFTSEVQVDLDMDEVTSARETYDKQGAVRQESQSQSQMGGGGSAIGVPGILSNTPPPAAIASQGPPGAAPTPAAAAPVNGETNATRTYELGREVAVSTTQPGRLKRLSVAIALNKATLKTKVSEVEQVKALVSAAVGADNARGDQVAVMIRNFDEPVVETPAFYEAAWFVNVLRYGAALIGLLLVLLLVVRPLLKAAATAAKPGEPLAIGAAGPSGAPGAGPDGSSAQVALLAEHINQFVLTKPDDAAQALRQMLKPGAPA